MKVRISTKVRRGLATVALVATAVGGVTAVPIPAFAGGGVDLQAYGCDKQAPGTNIVLRSWNAYGWRCYTGMYDLFLSVNQACKSQYGNGSTASYSDYNNPYSWRCS